MKAWRWNFQNLSKKFDTLFLFSNLNFYLGPGDLLLVTGASGSGKSTFLFIASLLLKPDTGTINSLFSIDYNKNSTLMTIRKKHIAFLSSTSLMLPCLTVFENLQLAAAFTNNDESLIDLLGTVNLLNLKNKYANQLSQGQQQQISLLMTIVKRPTLLLLDEPTSALDSFSAKRFLQLLDKRKQEFATIMTTHNKNLFDLGNMHFAIEKKKIEGRSSNNTFYTSNSLGTLIFHFAKIAFKNGKKELLFSLLLTFSLLLSFPLFFISFSLKQSVHNMYNSDQIVIFKLKASETTELKKTLQEAGISYRLNYDKYIAPFFAPNTNFFAMDNNIFQSHNQIMTTDSYLKSTKQKIGDLVFNSQFPRLTEYGLIDFSGFTIINSYNINGLYKSNIVFYSYELISQYLNEKYDVNNQDIEIATTNFLNVANQLDDLNIDYDCLYKTNMKEAIELADSLNILLILTLIISLLGVFLILFLLLLIIKKKRDDDLIKLFSLGGNNSDLRLFLVIEVFLHLICALIVTLIVFVQSGSILNHLLANLFPSKNLINFNYSIACSFLAIYLFLGVLFSTLTVLTMKLDIKERLI